ncbi:MAG: MFS transporter [Acidobacteria bacterium]|nr:MFS transporter [Acidobacteriota bacterium]
MQAHLFAAARRLASALTHRDFRLLWLGALGSTIGTWMQKVAQAWLIVTLTGTASAFFLGLDSLMGELPILLLTLVGGVIADRKDRRQLLLMSQYVQMTAAFILALLVYLGHIQVWHVLALSALTGVAQAFGGPAYQSLIPQLVSKENLPNAVALNSIQFNLARIIGPLIAGAALATFGMVACFGLNGVSFLFVIAALFALHVKHIPPTVQKPMIDEMKTGLRYVKGEPTIVALTVLGFVAAFLGLPLLTFLPIIVKDVFKQDVGLYTQLMAFSGSGAVLGAMTVAWMGKSRALGRTLLGGVFAFGCVMIAFSFSRQLWLSELLLFLGGGLLVSTFSMTTSLVQLIAPNEMRGRVMSIYMVAFRGASPLGNFVSGNVATALSVPSVIAINGGLLVIAAMIFWFRGRGVRET